MNMRTFKYIIFALLMQSFCFLPLLSQSETVKKKNKIPIFEELSICFINTIIEIDTIQTLNIFINADTTARTETMFIEDIGSRKISDFTLGVFYKRHNASGIFSLYENGNPFLDFNGGDGNSISLTAGYEFYISNRFLLETNIIYDQNFISSSTDYLLPIIDDEYATTKHTAELNIKYLSVNVLLKYEMFDNALLFSGFQYGFVIDSKYNHIVKIKSEEIIYDDGALEKHFNDRKLDNTNNNYSLLFGASYRVPFIAGNFGIEISGMYEMGLNKVFNNADLKSSSISGGIRLLYLF